jgi:hypothetical protein
MSMPKTPRYIAQGPGGYIVAPGQYVTPARRSYLSAEHAQLANPKGRLYVCTLDEENNRLAVEAAADLYPITLQEVRVPGIGAQADGAWVLLDLGPRKDMRWAVSFRNDQVGGRGNSDYCETLAEACAAFAKRVTYELERMPEIVEYLDASAAATA